MEIDSTYHDAKVSPFHNKLIKQTNVGDNNICRKQIWDLNQGSYFAVILFVIFNKKMDLRKVTKGTYLNLVLALLEVH